MVVHIVAHSIKGRGGGLHGAVGRGQGNVPDDPHMQESLLHPKTRLRVLSRKREGRVVCIKMDEVEAE